MKPNPGSTGPLRILIVDDHPPAARLLETVLALEGFIPRSFHDAESAYEFARGARPDLMLVDWRMPGTDGLELTRWIRADPLLAALPVLLCSAHPIVDEPAFHASGCDGYIAKPVNICQLGAHIRSVLADCRLRRPLPGATPS